MNSPLSETVGRRLRTWESHARGLRPLDVGLVLLAVASVLLAVEMYLQTLATNADLTALRAVAGNAASKAAVDNSAIVDRYGVNWSQVLQAVVVAAPGGSRVQEVGFATGAAGIQAIVRGEAGDYDEVVAFAENLRSSPVFSKVTIQSMNEAVLPTPTPTSTPTIAQKTAGAVPAASQTAEQAETPTADPSLTPTASANATTGVLLASTPTPPRIPVLPSATATAASSTAAGASGARLPIFTPAIFPPPFFTPASPPATPMPVPPPWLLAPATPTPMFPPWLLATATPTASATRFINAYYDFAVQGKTQTCDLTRPADYSGDLIAGQVLDVDEKGMAGLRLRVASIYTDAPWSAETTTDDEGRYRFFLTKGNFKVEVTSGTSEAATELWTRSVAEPGVCTWQVVFRKTAVRTPVAVPTWTPTPTTTSTRSPTITATPPRGTPVVGSQTTASNNEADAPLAIDGNIATMWNAGGPPFQYWQETFDNPISVAGFSLVVSQSPDGPTTHVVHLYGSNGFEISPSPITLTGYTADFQQLSQSFASPVAGVSTVRIETTSGPSYVAWREIRVIAGPTPTATPSPTATPRTWGRAQPIGIGDLQTRIFSYGGDVDWAVFHTAWITGTERVTHTVRAIGSGIDTDLELHEGSGDTGFVAYNNNACTGTNDPLIVQPLKPDTTYYVKVTNRGSSPGNYGLTVRTGALTCDSSVTASRSSSVPFDGPFASLRSPPAFPGPVRPPGLAAPVGQASLYQPAAIEAPLKLVRFTILLDVRSRRAQ